MRKFLSPRYSASTENKIMFPRRQFASSEKIHKKYRRYDPDALTKAYAAVKEDKMPVKKAARLHCVPETTLRQRVIGAVHIDTVKPGPSPLFSLEQEVRLFDHVVLLAKLGYGYTRSELCNLATEYAVELGFRRRDNPLSLQWYRNFISRWPNLAIKQPRSLAIARAKATSEHNVNAYFEELDKIMIKYNLKNNPQNIYNIDEKGISDNHTPPKIVADRNSTPVSVTSGMSSNVTILGAGNALGTAVPPYFIFKGKRLRSEVTQGATAGVSATVTDSGWSNGTVFKKYLEEHFIKYVQGRDSSETILVLYDGHKSHISLGIIDWAKQHNIVLFVLPPHTSHVLQPLDVGCFGPFQKIYNSLRAKFMREHSSSSLPKDVLCEIACKAYNLSLSAGNLCASFKKSGIYPFNPSAVDKMSFMPAIVFDSKYNKENTANERGDIGEVGIVIDSTDLPLLQTCTEAETFFKNKENVLLDKSKETKKRKVLSAVVGGKPITDDIIVQKIQDHQELQLPKNKVVKLSATKKLKRFIPPIKSANSHNVCAGPSGLHVPVPCVNDTDDSEEESEIISDQDLCCVCLKFQPPEMKNINFIEFVNWGQCSVIGCNHWVHLKYCTPVRFLRRHALFYCPCHTDVKNLGNLEE